MGTLLALAAALSYGTADFFGGAASRRAAAIPVLLVATPVGLALMLGVSLAAPGHPDPAGLAWGAAAGTCGGAAVMLFYGALAAGPMTVVAPVSALTSALLPVVVGAITGERLAPGALVGALLCLLAIGLVSAEKSESAVRRPRAGARGVLLAAVSGVGFGLFFVFGERAGHDTGLWPMFAARAAGIAVTGLAAWIVLRARPDLVKWTWTRHAGTLALAIGSGLLDAGGNALYLLATRGGTLTIAAVLTSLYPAITVLLARLSYGEMLRGIQKLGLLVAAAGVVMVTVN